MSRKTNPLTQAAQWFEDAFKKETLERLPPMVADPPEDLLCPDALSPEAAPDKVCIECRMDKGAFGPKPVPAFTGELTVGVWNLERGLHFDRQLQLIQEHPSLSRADILIINEADRGCTRTGCRHVARDLAKALKMNFIFAVEYVELPRESKLLVNHVDKTCEHGNALLSRFPLKKVKQIRHAKSENWYGRKDQPRLGGCISLRAELDLGGTPLHLYGVHLASGPQGEAFRRFQIRELLNDMKDLEGPILIGGDMNTLLYTVDVWTGGELDGATKQLRRAGFKDAHAGLPPWQRGTTDNTYGISGVIDLLFTRGVMVREAGRVTEALDQALSDHLPVWAKISL